MHIFIDESGTFAPVTGGKPAFSTVGAIIIPSSGITGFERLYRRVRMRLPKAEGEVKGRLLNEAEVCEVVKVLKKVGALFEVVAINMADHSIETIKSHMAKQAEYMFANVTPQHRPELIASLERYRDRLHATPPQLYVQSMALGTLIYDVINLCSTFFAFRLPKELASYHWTIDAKEKAKVTDWEEWWSTMVLPGIEARTFREGIMRVEGGDYRFHERYRVADIGCYKRQFVKNPTSGEFFDLKMLLKEDFRFSAEPEFGLEVVDILTNAIRRSLNGNLSRAGWSLIPEIMIHRRSHYITLAHLTDNSIGKVRASWMRVLNDFRTSGRSLIPSFLG
jgi:hypothetical protein